MNKALLYRPNNHKLTWVAFECTITIFLTAIAIAGNQPKPLTVVASDDFGGPPIEVYVPPLEEQPEITPPEPVPINDEEQEFTDDTVQTPIRPRKKMPVTAARSSNIGAGQTTHAGSARALTLYAPKPNYPYEARRGGITGSGIAQLIVNSPSGNVVNAHMAQSTGNAILDNATVEALRRWRFKPGVASNVDVPITFTLSGVSY